MEISAQFVKQLRDRTGAGMMECKNALTKTGGDIEQAIDQLRKHSLITAGKKATRSTRQGIVTSYIHPGSQVGVLIEVNCESDFVARTTDFIELVHDLAMQVAAADPRFVRKEDVTPDMIDAERKLQRNRAEKEGKPAELIEKIVQGRMTKFYQDVCLYEQSWIKESSMSVGDRIKTTIAKLGENISVSRFTRMKVGEKQKTDQGAVIHE